MTEGERRRALAVTACAAALFLAAGSAGAEGAWLYANSFDHGLDAEFAAGEAKGVSEGRTAAVPTGDERHGSALAIPFSDHFCLPLDGNLSFEEGTIRMDVQPRFNAPEVREGYERSQCLLSTKIRSGPSLTLYVRGLGRKTMLVLETVAEREAQPSRVVADISGWTAGSWHTVEVAWKQPGQLALTVDGVEKEITDARLPRLPAAMMYDLFVGTNSNGTPGYGSTEHADFLFDNLAIFSVYKYRPAADEKPPSPPVVEVPASVDRDPLWVGRDAHRINVFAGKTRRDWARVPVRLEVDFGEPWNALDGAGRRAAIASLRLVEYDPATGQPIVQDEKRSGDERYFLPFRISPELYWQSSGVVSWVRTGNRESAYSLYYDCAAPYEAPFPDTVPMTGDGDRLQLGRKGDANRLSLGIAGSFEPFAPGADGRWGLWGNVGTDSFPRSRDLGYGLYYFERVERDGKDPVLAPGQLIYRGGTPFEAMVNGNSLLNLADLNGDGKPDFIYSGYKVSEWWEFEMKNGKPVVTAQHRIPFKGKPPKGEAKSRVYDFDGDGLMDLQLGRKVLLNVGTPTAPLFDAEKPVELDMDAPVAFGESSGDDESTAREWLYFPVDWDGDGLRDIISSSNFPQLFFRKNIGTNEAPKFTRRMRLKTFEDQELEVVTMLTRVNVLDWDGDGDLDLLFGGEEGYVGLCENIAGPGRQPQLLQTVYLNQLDAPLDAGSLAIPTAVDWDDDGDLDLVVGNSAGHLLLFENTGSTQTPVWAEGRPLVADGVPIRLLPGPDGSVQGAGENYWGYTNVIVVDWDGDGLKDVIATGNRMTHHFFRNIGRKGAPQLAAGKLLLLEEPPRDAAGKRTDLPWGLRYQPQGNELITAHRSRPQALDWNGDGVMDYIAIDHKNELALYPGRKLPSGDVVLGPPQNIFRIDGPFARGIVWNRPDAGDTKLQPGSAGRTVVNIVDWDQDGRLDLIYDNINGRYYRNVGDHRSPHFVDQGDLARERLANHNSGPEAVDFDGDGWLDLFVGTESGRIFYFHRSYLERDIPAVTVLSSQSR